MADKRLYVLASNVAISEQKSSSIFLLVTMRILTTQPNGNAEGVTPQFIDEIVNNPEKYSCLPLYADVDRLLCGDYLHLGHMLDAETGSFGSTQIGSITLFRKVEDEFGTSLIAEGRIPKREAEVCNALMELYRAGQLNFSFEIKYMRSATVEQDGVLYIDANEENALTGVAVVSVPAYKESVALNLVAEKNEENGMEAKGVENGMTLEEAMASLAEKDAAIAALTARAEDAEKKLNDETAKAPETALEMANTKAALEKAEATIAERDAKITELQASCDSLKAAEQELTEMKQAKARAELEANQAKAKAFAEQQGLDPAKEDVAHAIAELDYKTLAELSMASKKPDKPDMVIAGLMTTDGFAMRGSKYADLLATVD